MRFAQIQAIDQKCENLKTAPELRAILIKALKAWIQWNVRDTGAHFSIDPTTASSPVLTRMIANQNDIGWQHVFLGRFGHELSGVQEVH